MLSCRDMARQLNIYWIGIEMVGRAGFKSFGFTLRAELATSLSRYGLTIEYLLNWELNTKAGLEMVGRAGFKSFGFTLRAEPATSLRGMA
ncbi:MULTISPECIES: hypothetical protein [Providencia]|uniref:hypothetical protein n=1 Tax=Providencia TaxID=586 RepID=UPI0013A6124A|nr:MULTISPECIES: hypothetical protein [Providencia]WOB80832.1 hypothetical protein P3L37_14050 [Providencia sp. PROV114]HEE8951608.1 hypothetical protein [Providencia rettgeri]HEM6856419.1 hypothetical protein [Providencia rettgeri]HEM7527032.1 hypothetical protein [Providencia rettgeri]